MNIILLPNWVEKALLSNTYNLVDVTKPHVLLSILSREDVAFYLYLNQNLNRWLPKELADTFETGNDVLGFKAEIHIEHIDRLILGYSMSKTTSNKNTCELFDVLDAAIAESDIKFELKNLNEDTFVILPRKEDGVTHLGLCNDLLHLLVNRSSLELVSQTPLFKYMVALM